MRTRHHSGHGTTQAERQLQGSRSLDPRSDTREHTPDSSRNHLSAGAGRSERARGVGRGAHAPQFPAAWPPRSAPPAAAPGLRVSAGPAPPALASGDIVLPCDSLPPSRVHFPSQFTVYSYLHHLPPPGDLKFHKVGNNLHPFC